MVIDGTASMLQLMVGIDATPISMMPFTPAFTDPLYLPALDVGIDIHPGGYVQTLPVIGAYVGADIVAGIMPPGLAREATMRVFVDVGTNGEIGLGSVKRVLCTAAPAGPAFEGSQIRCGMRATEGAIEGVTLTDHIELQVIGGDILPRGICGSGLVDTVAQLRLAGLLDVGGKMRSREEVPEHPLSDRLITVEGVRAFLLAENVYLTQRDVRELQFGKGSIATGIKVLMDVMGISATDLDEVLLGGSFGSYLNPESAKIIGLVPAVDVNGILWVGNPAARAPRWRYCPFANGRSPSSFRTRSNTSNSPGAQTSTTPSCRCCSSRSSRPCDEAHRPSHLWRVGPGGQSPRRCPRMGRRHLRRAGDAALLSKEDRRVSRPATQRARAAIPPGGRGLRRLRPGRCAGAGARQARRAAGARAALLRDVCRSSHLRTVGG